MIRILALFALSLTFTLGCGDSRERTSTGDGGGGGTGTVDPSRTIASLSLEEARAICEDFVEAQGGAGTTATCSGGIELTVQPVDDCAASVEAATCTNTVAEMNACFAALDGDACKLLTDPACAFVAECATSGG